MKYKKVIIFIILFYLKANLNAQNQQEADSLVKVLNEQEDFSDSLITATLFKIVVTSSSPQDILNYSELYT